MARLAGAHVNIDRIELMPTCQAGGGFVVKRQEGK